MESALSKVKRTYGYDILINTLEPFMRKYISDFLLLKYGNDWRSFIPEGVIKELIDSKQVQYVEDLTMDEFFDELTFLNLKDILVAFSNFKLAKPFLGELSKDKFLELMDNLNYYRRKIAHHRSSFSELDLMTLIDQVKMVCQGEKGQELKQYLENEGYKNATDIPESFFEEYNIPNNLPAENYDLDGGFVGREKEIRTIRNYLKSDQDRVITITGAGGVGKTAIALRVAYSFLSDLQNPFEAIVWFSAKMSKLTDEGISPLDPGIKSYQQLISDILEILDPTSLRNFKKGKVPTDSYSAYLNDFFCTHKCLLIIDNLETIIRDELIVKFIEEIPRPSQVLITSRKGLGEIEKRYPIADMLEKDAILLFRIVAKERNRQDLLRLKEVTIFSLVKSVKCYPLLIKWGIGQICLGREIDKAFSQIFSGESEIAKFVFNDVFSLLSENSKSMLYSMIVYGNKPLSKGILMHLSNLDDDQFEDAIRELAIASFVFPQTTDTESGPTTEYIMLELTRGFVETKLDEDEKTRQMLLTRLYHLTEQIQEYEQSKSSYFQSLFSLGIKTPEEQVAFNYVKAAKVFLYNGDFENAEKNFNLALKFAPKLSYVLTEYSKFKFKRKHISEALRLAEEAVKVNPESFHAWFNYGIMLEKVHKDEEAVKPLLKAKELNPKHLPIHTELGRVYSFMGEYEKAEAEFVSALQEEKYPNFRHKMITIQSKAENYRKWAVMFGRRHDMENQLKMLNKAMDTISTIPTLSANDKEAMGIFQRICLDLGLAHSRFEGFEGAKPYLEKCLKPFKIGNRIILSNTGHSGAACYYLALFAMRENNQDKKQIENWINQGLTTCRDTEMVDKLNALKRKVLGIDSSSFDNRVFGKIKSFNAQRKFGILESSGKTYLFLLSGFRKMMGTDEMYELEGKTVTFRLVKSKKKEGELIAVDIVLEQR